MTLVHHCQRFLALVAAFMATLPMWLARDAAAQVTPPPSVVSACSGVRLPRSVVTDIMAPVITGIAGPTENSVNSILGVIKVIPIVGQILPSLSLNATGLLNTAASGSDITLSVLNRSGQIVGPGDACNGQADTYSLTTARGLSIGGNQITGLGANGSPADAGEINSIAFGNAASTAASSMNAVAIGRSATVGANAAGSVALGANASVTAANSLALGAGSVASGGARTGYTAIGLTGPQTSAGEVSFGAAGAARQLTNVAPGLASTDAVNVGQLAGVAASLTALADTSVRYTDVLAGRVVLAGTTGTTISNLNAGLLSATSSEAVNGAQLFATNTQVAALADTSVRYTDVLAGRVVLAGASGTTLTNLKAGLLSATSSDAVNGAQLFATDTQVAANTNNITTNTTALTNLYNNVVQGALGPVRYSNAGTPNTPNGGTITNSLTLVGLTPGPVGLHSLAAGLIGSGSTDAVNGGQVFDLAARLAGGFGGATTYNPASNLLDVRLTYQGVAYTSVQDVLNSITVPSGAANPYLAVFSTGVAASASGLDALAVGPGASASADNSAALGASSVAARGAQTSYAALGLTGAQTSVGEVSIGALGAERQLTNVAAGSSATDAVNLGQLQGVSTQLSALADTSVRYTDVLAGRVVLAGTTGTTISNLNAGLLSATSSEAVNGAQLFGLANRLAGGFGGATSFDPTSNLLNVSLSYNGATYTNLQGVLNSIPTASAGPSPYLSVSSSGAAASATGLDAVAIGPDAVASAANSVAIGSASTAARGALTDYAAVGLTGPQSSAGEVSIGSLRAARQLTNVAAGSADTDAVNVSQLMGVAGQVSLLSDTSVRYTDALAGRIVLAGTTGTTITNLLAGSLSATSMDAVNGAQLFDTNSLIAANTNSIFNNTTAISNLRTILSQITAPLNGGANPYVAITATGGPASAIGNNTVAIGQDAAVTADNSIALGAGSTASRGASTAYAAIGLSSPQSSAGEVSVGRAGAERQVTNVAAGVANTDAVNVGQLQGVAARIDAVSQTAVSYDNSTRSTLTLAGAGGTTITNLSAGQLTQTSTDAVNGSQLFATNQAVAANTTAIANLTTNIANGSLGPVQYSNSATPTQPNGGGRTDDLVLVGASGGPVALHNVAAGHIAEGSTDAVNGGQIHQLALQAANAVTYDVDSNGVRTGAVSLAGVSGAAVTVNNVAAGALSDTSTQAVNGAQLFATNQAVTTANTTANTALSLGMNSVQYDAGRTSIQLGQAGAPVRMSNLAQGIAPGDAVNVQQLNDSIRQAVTDASTYTDMRFALANFQMGRLRDEMNAGAAGALAAAALPQITEPGRGMMAVSFGSYEGQSAVAIGFSRSTPSGGAVIRGGATYDGQGRTGINGGVGWRF